MKLYHGSDVPVQKIDLGRALMFKDLFIEVKSSNFVLTSIG